MRRIERHFALKSELFGTESLGRDLCIEQDMDEDALEFWGDRWPYELKSVTARRVSILLTDPRTQREFDAYFDLRDKYVLFVYQTNEPFLLRREPGRS